MNIELKPLSPEDHDRFIRDNQDAFNYGALQEFGLRDDHFEEDGEIISKETIENAIRDGEAYRIVCDDEKIGGMVVKIDGERGELELLFVSPSAHSKGIGFKAWCEMEKLHPEVKVWETVTPYFEKRNIHFYVNRCGFHIVEFFNKHHPDPNDTDTSEGTNEQFPDDFAHEQCLVIKQDGKHWLLSGCSHNGILNILDRYKEIFGNTPDYVLTGFHMMKKDGEYTEEERAVIIQTAQELSQLDTVFYSGHCTGIPAFELMKDIMGDKLIALHSGEQVIYY